MVPAVWPGEKYWVGLPFIHWCLSFGARKIDDGEKEKKKEKKEKKRKEWRFYWPLHHCQQSTARTATPEQRPLERCTLVPIFVILSYCNLNELIIGHIFKTKRRGHEVWSKSGCIFFYLASWISRSPHVRLFVRLSVRLCVSSLKLHLAQAMLLAKMLAMLQHLQCCNTCDVATLAICNTCNLQTLQLSTLATCNTCNACNLQCLQFAMLAICNACNLQRLQFATRAIFNACNLQHVQFEEYPQLHYGSEEGPTLWVG